MMKKPVKNLLRRTRRRLATANAGGARPSSDSVPSRLLDWPRIALAFFSIAALSLLMSVHLLPDKISLRLGQVSPREVRAGRSVTFLNSVRTAQQQQAAMQGTPPVYDTDEGAVFDADRVVRDLFDRIENERARHPLHARAKTFDQTLDALVPAFRSTLTRAQLSHLLTLSPALFHRLRDTASRLIVDDAMKRDLRNLAEDLRPTDDLRHARQYVVETAADVLPSDEDAAIVGAVAAQALRPNRLLNRTKTAHTREAAARAIPTVYERIAQGDKIIGVGEVVTQEHLDKFAALGLINPRLELTTGAFICVLAAAMVLFVVLYIKRTLPALYNDTRRLALLTVIVLLSVLGLKFGATMLGLSFSSGQLGYLGMMSVAAAGMLVSVLLDANLAVLIVALLSVQSGLIMNHEIRFTVMTLMSSLVGIVSVSSARHRNNLPATTVALAGTNLALVWLLGRLFDTTQELLTGSLWAVGAAFFATFLFWFGVMALEKPFGILTHTTLLEMSAFDRPLLKQLCASAPGTYAHSMMVGTLAEAGAQAVGAEALLCRVGGYYHDIGKMKRPDFFVENQRRENVHGRLSPSLSALIITAHVRDGIELAQEHRLPDEIRDIIAQHHGTTLIRYFYHQALTDCGGSDEAPPGLEERFRYPGPKPQTREAAVVMLADSVEAAARCLEKPSLERLEALVQNIVRDKIEDGQLDDCDLTFKDIKGISQAFLHVLTAMMHGRIDYPEAPPRSGSGRPMDVVRPDLRPEPEPLVLPLTDAERNATSDALPPLVSSLDTEASREIAAHLGTPQPLGAVGGYREREESEPDAPHLAPLESASAGEHAGSPLLPIPYVEPEVLYGRVSAEFAADPDPNDRATPGRPPSSKRRRAS